MRMFKKVLLAGGLAAAVTVTVGAQVHKFFTPGTVWTVTMIQVAPGMDQMQHEYLAGQFKKG